MGAATNNLLYSAYVYEDNKDKYYSVYTNHEGTWIALDWGTLPLTGNAMHYLLHNFDVVAQGTEIQIQLTLGSLPIPIYLCSAKFDLNSITTVWGRRLRGAQSFGLGYIQYDEV